MGSSRYLAMIVAGVFEVQTRLFVFASELVGVTEDDLVVPVAAVLESQVVDGDEAVPILAQNSLQLHFEVFVMSDGDFHEFPCVTCD